MAEVVAGRPPPSPVLLAGRNIGPVHRALEDAGARVVRWRRWAEPGPDDGGESPASSAWPPEGPFASGVLRLPRAKDELDMEAQAVLSRLAPGGTLFLFGTRDEGVVSAPRRLEPLIGAGGSSVTLAVKARCRVIEIRRGASAPSNGRVLSDWTRKSSMVIGGRQRPWVSYPGLFAGGAMDPGTALLLGSLPRIAPGSRVLDYGCGTGVIGAAVLESEPGARVDLLDADALALEAARSNVPGARVLPAAYSLGGADGLYDWILSNPPFHEGKGETVGVLEALLSEAPGHVSKRGGLVIVTQRRIPVERAMAKSFRTVAILGETPVFRVWSGVGTR